ncbi:MAG: KH domain-containing protein, partial [Nanoarchaeota archaeon]
MDERKTVKFKKDEFAIKEYTKKFVGKGKLSKVRIEYTPIGEKIIISTHKPGLIIGKGGERIIELTNILKKQFKLENPHIEIDEI